MKLLILLVFVFGSAGNLYCQNSPKNIFISFGYSKIPLKIKRTNELRWMTYPTFKGGYRIGPKIILHGYFMGNDASIKNYSKDELDKYKETPNLTSYEIAKMYEGQKFTLSLFHDYLFAGIEYEHYSNRLINLNTSIDLGFRFGETSLLTNIIENQFRPNGFEVHATKLSSDSPGLKFSLNPNITLFKYLNIEVAVGSYVFINWPITQLFANLQVGISL